MSLMYGALSKMNFFTVRPVFGIWRVEMSMYAAVDRHSVSPCSISWVTDDWNATIPLISPRICAAVLYFHSVYFAPSTSTSDNVYTGTLLSADNTP